MTEDRAPSFLRRHLAGHADTEEALVGLACDDSLWVRRQALQNPATPGWVIDLLIRAGADPELRGRGEPDPDMSADDLRRLVECGPWAHDLVARHPNTDAEVLAALALHPHDRIRLTVAGHHHTSPETLAHLCADPDPRVRHATASHGRPPHDAIALMRLAGADADLAGVTGPADGELDPGELTELADLGPWGRFLAARHAACPPDVLAATAADADWRIRSAVLDNPATPADMIEAVTGGETFGAADLPSLGDRAAPASTLVRLASHPSAEVRLAVARHPAAEASVIGMLAADRVADVRCTAGRHRQMDADLLSLLVRAGSTPDLAGLAPLDDSVTADELGGLSRGGYWARQLAVRHPDTPQDALAHLLCDEDPKLREWAAAHPGVPRDIVELLLAAGAATDFQGIAPPTDPEMSPAELARVAALGPYGELVASWHPNTPGVGDSTV